MMFLIRSVRRFLVFLLPLFAVPHGFAAEGSPHDAKLKNPDGSWKYTNRLIDETSPYLQLHAHNPVDWYPWGPEALERAKAEDKPIFLSIGYSTCYWCHVMERLVFSDPEIAKLMNEWFINIKVDREERPDLDRIYMTATQLFTGGSGGWPNSVFLTPDLKPFYAGTYFPPEDMGGKPGFPSVLRALHNAWTTRRDEVEEQAEKIAEAIRQLQTGETADETEATLDRNLVERATEELLRRFDSGNGGFSDPPKFPAENEIAFLLDEYERTKDERLLDAAIFTLRKMARGGIHDQLGGGFHRYATDTLWRIPHFEKMLYTQAQLARLYARAFALTGEDEFRRVAEGILRFVDEVMTSPEGGFYSALDAETDAVEGAYYVWTKEAIDDLLGWRDRKLFWEVYDLQRVPGEEGSVLFIKKAPVDLARDRRTSEEKILKRLERPIRRLLKERAKRKLPLLDTKIVAGWNGLMIESLAEVARYLDEPIYLERAKRAADFIWNRLRDENGTLYRVYRDGKRTRPAYQEDDAFVARGMLALYEATGSAVYLDRAETLTAEMIDRFWDAKDGGFYLSEASDDLLARVKSPQDGAMPSGNSAAVHLLVRLYEATGKAEYLDRAFATCRAFGGTLTKYPGGFSHMIAGLARLLDVAPPESVLAAPPEDLVRVDGFVAVDRVAPGGAFQVAARLRIEEGWHVQGNPASLDYLKPTTLELLPHPLLRLEDVTYPEAVEQYFAFAGEKLRVYDGEIVLRATLRLSETATPGERLRIPLRVTYQACDDSRCLAPTTETLTLDVRVAAPGETPRRQHSDIFADRDR